MARICRKIPRAKLRKKPPIEDHTSNLPCDIFQNILSNLPVKSLLRFKSLSKQWYSIISDPKFARVHLHQSRNSHYKSILANLLHTQRDQTFALLKLTNQTFQVESLELPLKIYRQGHVLCSCDGLVLLNSREGGNMCIWNPSTRAYTKFPCMYSINSFSTFSKTYGFCYDASNDDYKVVLLISNIRYAVFSDKNNSWIEKEDHSLLRILPDPGLFVHGALHWIWCESSIDFEGQLHNTYEICCFDPRDDKFKKLSKPACFDISFVFHLADLRGQLCLYRNTDDCTVVEIWMMKEYGDCNSWTKLLMIENVFVPNVQPLCFRVKPLCLTNENNVVLEITRPATQGGSAIVVYNPKKRKFVEEYLKLAAIFCLDESLVLPSRTNKTEFESTRLRID